MDESNIAQLDLHYAEMIKMNCMDDPEISHSWADDLLVELLQELGCLKTAEAFKEVPKWYA